MGRLTTHVLDTAQGCPAAGVSIQLFKIESAHEEIAAGKTNADGRLDAPLLEGEAFQAGVYELVFQAGEYFRRSNLEVPDPAFVDEIVLRFGIANSEQHYHVPLLVSPWAYSTYRGS